MSITVYGIKNCDTVKKVLKWLDSNGVIYNFHDYKKNDPDINILKQAIDQYGWEIVINKRGTTWRKLPDDIKTNTNNNNVIDLAIKNPSIIKRPMVAKGDHILLGFDETIYKDTLL